MTRSRVLVALGGLAISAFFLWLAIRDADAAEVKAALDDARIELVLLAVVVLLCGYLFQAMRWRRVANVSHPGLRRFYEMVICGLACNNVLPIRIGELLRAGWLSRDAPMSGGRALGTVALDRVCDVVTLAVLLVIGIQAVPTPDWLKRIVIGALIALVLLAAALVFARWYTRTRERDRRTRSRVRRIIRDTIDMLGEPVGRRRAAVWLGLSAVAWTLGTFAVFLVGRSVGIDLAAARRGLRRIRARPRRRDPVLARLRGHVPVARRRVARAPRRAGERGARLFHPHAGELVHPDDADRRGDSRLAGAANGQELRAGSGRG